MTHHWPHFLSRRQNKHRHLIILVPTTFCDFSSMDNSSNPTSAMAAAVSSLELCSLCRDTAACAFLESGRVYARQSRGDLLEAQHKCYICTWIGYSLTSEQLENLPQMFGLFFEFNFNRGGQGAQYKHKCISLWVVIGRPFDHSVDGLPLSLNFCAIQNTGMTYDRN